MNPSKPDHLRNKDFAWNIALAVEIMLYLCLTTAIFVVQKKIHILKEMQSKPASQQTKHTQAKAKTFLPAKELELQDSLQQSPKDITTRQKLAQLYYQHGKAEKSITQYHKILQLEPGNVEAHLALGILYMARKHSASKAIEHLKKVSLLQPNHTQKKIIDLWLTQLEKQQGK